MANFGAAVLGDAIYVAGGTTDTGLTQAAYRLSAGTEKWVPIADLPEPRAGVTLVSTGDAVYAIGGYVGSSPGFIEDDRMLKYLAGTDEWIDAPHRPDRRTNATYVGAPGRVIMLGGSLGSVEHGGLTPGDTVAWYDQTSGAWSYGSAMKHPRTNARGVNVNGIVYVFGGNLQEDNGSLAQVIELYDWSSNTWSTVDHGLASQLLGSYGWAAVFAAGEVHVFGGFVPIPPYGAWTADHAVYDPSTGVWQSLLPIPRGRSLAGVVELQGAIWLMGGQKGSQALPNPFTEIVEIYDLQ